ncbi:hypothetical protein RhiJN_19098 [Ceratobasidium sp. AG-Ba]|nr:hypothetical protein RhiJN_04276 [Ceratobasidium sp. AG-Ba]QRV91080.1 hypothetical protein RhiJN_19098 [Ceratobasidium sp. AG-Ba]QRW05166.1 hypothetical protein RhiLY_04165 [Ceratobasidium sp. AG-Ba]
MILPQESSLVVIARSELPTATYPVSSLKKAPSYDSIPQMKEKSVRFSAIIDIHEFSRLAGEPFGMVQPSKAPGVKAPPRTDSGLGHSERSRLTLDLEPAPMKSSYNHRITDDDNDYYSRSRYD